MPFRAPTGEYSFIFEHIIGIDQISATDQFNDASPDVVAAVLTEAAKLTDEVMAPLQRAGDLTPAQLANGAVRSPPGFAEGYKAIADGGWVGISAAPEHGGMGLPLSVGMAVNDMMSGACLSLQLNPLLTQGQIEALAHHACPELQALYLPKLISGEWTGTMNLTEPHAGTDVGALSAKAVPQQDGSYRVSGQKIFISWGDHDMTENICHLVLARLPDAPAGTKGISLFMVPKFLPDAGGNPGTRNGVTVVSLEHKKGLHGSPTAVLEFQGATGWLVGAPHAGMAAMFTMMNNARLGVGVQGIGVAEAAFQHALAYALERKQGKTPTGHDCIADHADVRRMLMTMKADIFAARCIALSCAAALDMAQATGQDGWAARAAFLTPIAKAFGTDTGIEVSTTAEQVHGGMGVIEETGVAQFSRDVRVTAIYEGTNGIQAMDLVARKLMDGGDAAERLLQEIQDHAETSRAALPDLAGAVWDASENLREATEWMLARADLQDRFAGAVPYLRAFARVLGGHFHLKAARAVDGIGARHALAAFYIRRLLPEHTGLIEHARAGADGLYALDLDALAG